MDVLSNWRQRGPSYAGVSPTFMLALLMLLSWSAGSASADEAEFSDSDPQESAPYVVFVSEPSAFVRCGPGTVHYRTEPLRRGQELEVYVETADGWLGVRPPEQSFCWMPADAVEQSGDGTTATILEDKTVAWIGTHLGQARRYRWQVELNAGEQVSILGQNDREGSAGTKTWFRIVPPPGEFRWIHRDDVVESAEQLVEKIAQSSSGTKRSGKVATVALAGDVVANPASNHHDVRNRDDVSSENESGPLSVASNQSSRRNSTDGGLQAVAEIPQLSPAPSSPDFDQMDASQNGAARRREVAVADKAIQFHRGARVEDFEDRGAVIGSGLKTDWQNETDDDNDGSPLADSDSQSILSSDRLSDIPSSGAAAAASAIAAPLKRVSEVVANFISPPRLVEINSSYNNAFDAASAADRRWMVGSGRSADAQQFGSQQSPSTFTPPQSLAATSLAGGIDNAASEPGRGVMQATALGTTPFPQTTPQQRTSAPSRIVTVAQIARVEDAVKNADVNAVGQILSKLMAEAASADEIDPLIRRTEILLHSGGVNAATRTREILDLAQRYRSVASRRDGVTTIHSTAATARTEPLTGPLVGSIPMQAAETDNIRTAAPYAGDVTPPLTASTRQPIETTLGPVAGTATGYLVQVYSSRANSPPFALTDDSGLTIAYVTPYPGVNLRNHLNSRIAVSGNEKLLEGMATPHILVDRAVRR